MNDKQPYLQVYTEDDTLLFSAGPPASHADITIPISKPITLNILYDDPDPTIKIKILGLTKNDLKDSRSET